MIKMTRKTYTGDRTSWPADRGQSPIQRDHRTWLSDGSQTVMRNGKRAVVVLSAEEWQLKTGRNGKLANFFATPPLRGSGLKIKRSKGGQRAIQL